MLVWAWPSPQIPSASASKMTSRVFIFISPRYAHDVRKPAIRKEGQVHFKKLNLAPFLFARCRERAFNEGSFRLTPYQTPRDQSGQQFQMYRGWETTTRRALTTDPYGSIVCVSTDPLQNRIELSTSESDLSAVTDTSRSPTNDFIVLRHAAYLAWDTSDV